MASSTPRLSISNSEENTKQQLSKFTTSEIIDGMHKIWTSKQITQLIDHLSSAKSEDPSSQSPKNDDYVPPPPSMPRPMRPRLDTKISFGDAKKKESVFEGWLFKRGKGLSNAFKKRYFVLYTNCTLMYFEKKTDVKSKKNEGSEIFLCEFTALEKVKSTKENEFKFQIVSKARTFFLKTEDAQKYNTWTKRLTERILPSKLYKGWAMKTSLKNGKKGKWQKRYFALCRYEYVNYELRYYEDSKCQRFKGMIDIADVVNVVAVNGKNAIKEYGSSNNICLEITHRSKVLVMSFKDATIRDEWQKKIASIVSKKVSDQSGTPVYSPSVSSLGTLAEDKSCEVAASGGWLDDMVNSPDAVDDDAKEVETPKAKKETKKEKKEREKKEKKQREKEAKKKKEDEKKRKKEEEKRKKEEKKNKKAQAKSKPKEVEQIKKKAVEPKIEPKIEEVKVEKKAVVEEKPNTEAQMNEDEQVAAEQENNDIEEDQPEIAHHDDESEQHQYDDHEEDDFALDFADDNEEEDNGDEYPEDSLPDGWIVCYTEDDNAYYHNEQTGVTQWERPE